MNSNTCFKKGTKLIITCQGLKNGLNNRKDGYAYFGYYPYNMSIPLDDDNNKMIDCNLASKNSYNNENLHDDSVNNLGRHFVIEYNTWLNFLLLQYNTHLYPYKFGLHFQMYIRLLS